MTPDGERSAKRSARFLPHIRGWMNGLPSWKHQVKMRMLVAPTQAARNATEFSHRHMGSRAGIGGRWKSNNLIMTTKTTTTKRIKKLNGPILCGANRNA